MKFNINYLKLKDIKTDCLVLGIFECNRLQGISQELDLYTNGYLNTAIQNGDLHGTLNHTFLLNNFKNINCKRVLFIGCGKEKKFNFYTYKKVLQTSINKICNTRANKIVLSLHELNVVNRNTYWKLRLAIEFIKDVLYVHPNFKTKKKINNF